MALRPSAILAILLTTGAFAALFLWHEGKPCGAAAVNPTDFRAAGAAATEAKGQGVHDSLKAAEPASPADAAQFTAQLEALQRKDRGAVATPCTPPQKPALDDDEPEFRGIAIELVRTRALPAPPAATVKVERQEIARRILQWLSEEYPKDYGPNLGRAFAALGAIPEPVDVIALKAAFLSYEIGAWYDPGEGTLYLADSDPGGEGKENALGLAYGHLFRAYGEALFPREHPLWTTDARLAREALLAGDSALTRLLHSVANPEKGGGGGVGEDPDDPSYSAGLPHFLREMELAPFGHGLSFVQALHSLAGMAQVNAAYQRPPESWAEIADVQLFLAETPPYAPPIVWPDVKIEGRAPVFSDTMGVLCLTLYLKEFLPVATAVPATEGWANDRLLTYAAGGKSRDHAVWQTRWKDQPSAAAFFHAMEQHLAGRYKAGSAALTTAGSWKIEAAGRVVMLQRTDHGTGVLFVDAASGAFASAAVAKLAVE